MRGCGSWVWIPGATLTVGVIDLPVKRSGAEDGRGEDGEYYWDGGRQRVNGVQEGSSQSEGCSGHE